MISDSDRWDLIHKKTSSDIVLHSHYAQEKEILFPRNSIVCDIGGGAGADALYFLKKGHKVILLDISDFALELAKKRAKEAGLDQALITNQIDFGLHQLPLKDNSIDVCYSRISLIYFPFSETQELIGQVFKSLKSQGKAFLTFKSPEDNDEMEYLKENAVEYEDNVYIENGQLRSRFSKEQLKKMLENLSISHFQISDYIEPLTNNEGTSHHNLKLIEVVFDKI